MQVQETQHVVKDEIGERIKLLFEEFLENFQNDDGRRVYVEQIAEMTKRDLTTIFVDFSHLLDYQQELAEPIEEQFYRFEPFLRQAVEKVVRKFHPPSFSSAAEEAENANTKDYFVSFFNLPFVLKIRDLRSDKIGRLISISATVTRTSEVRPELLFASFYCMDCQSRSGIIEQQFKYTEPRTLR
eukprot:TRINITY_DN11474_c0_g1_i1.p1 TRINITY_DN11474_c0_g1~~TRINITY_DN11474_c0_g1_i1.p1  ORF type:complete len:194 (+),score=66.70 TRINITY_DN11474_c0_g1_i1:29-583(+)